jgi:MFS family permease
MKNNPHYGYVILVASTIILVVGYGTFYSYSVFFDSLSRDFNMSNGATSLVFSLATLLSGFISIAAGRLNDRMGPRAIILFCGSALGVGYFLMSVASTAWQAFLIYFVFGAIGAGGIYPAAVPTVARWFSRRRGLALSIVTAGVGIGTAVFPPIISRLITRYEWRMSYVICAITTLATVIIASQFLKKEPQSISADDFELKSDQETGPTLVKDFTLRQAFRTSQYWLIVLSYFCIGYVQSSMQVHIVPYATGFKIDAFSAATILTVFSASSVLGRLIVGAVGDRVRIKPLLVGLMTFLFFSTLGIEFTHSLWGFFLVGVPLGLGYGSSSTLQPLAITKMFGLSSMGVLLGTMLLSVCIGFAMGPAVTGILVDVTHSYRLALMSVVFVALVGLILSLWLTPKY